MLLLFLPSGQRRTSLVARPGSGDIIQRPAAPGTATITRPGSGDIVQRPDAATA